MVFLFCVFFYSNTGSGKKRYNVPTDIEASLDHLSLQACPLVVLEQADAKPGPLNLSKSSAETKPDRVQLVRLPSSRHFVLLGSYVDQGISLLAY